MQDSRKYLIFGAASVIFLLISLSCIIVILLSENGKGKEHGERTMALKSEDNSTILKTDSDKKVERKLKMVQMIWRHGDRAPQSLPYPNDRNDEKMWPRGWNQLTNKGIKEARDLGVFFRNYYKSSGFLQEFHKDRVYILSSETERTIMTAQAFAAGCFPPNEDSIWDNSSLKTWQPTPIHTTGPTEPDAFLMWRYINCPKLKQIYKADKKLVKKKIKKEYKELFKMLQNYTGYPKVNFDIVSSLYGIQHEMFHNMEQPGWIHEIWQNKSVIEHLRELKRIHKNLKMNSPEKAKFRGGLLLNGLIQNMLDFNSGASTINQYLYSSHDGTLAALGYALNVSDHQLVTYVATYILELYDDNSVQVLYRNNIVDAPKSLIIPGCERFCAMDKFLKLFENVRVKSYDELYLICGTGTKL
ncbi:unnamed protein product [Caenorhabditis angaria]|uniref:Uncharacterized protein n=1 Tax=Caenorhabditis angaria TaxID=860376 RepID=A0A9P1MTJ8_9PELO|nr:unnamed protein product [Caenorhabditis angaria]